MKEFFQKKPLNIYVFIAVIILTVLTGMIQRSEFQIVILLTTFISAGILLKRHWLFAGIAVMVISIIFTIHDFAKMDSGDSGKFIKKFQFHMGTDKDEE
ncbi:MAG TPA: hypothetical protein PKG52_02620 [bacterium]|nr:hypothetical protein [bacterium]HPS29493.1 hypothetical protein [bacterium]